MPLVKKTNFDAEYRRMHSNGEKVVREILSIVQGRHEELVRPWDLARDRPTFTSTIKAGPGLIIGEVKLTAEKAEKAGISVWQLLNKGTRIRYMKLSQEGDPAGAWQSKTSPRQLTSGPGAGAKIGLDFDDPDPGIRKREFDKTVAVSVAAEAKEKIRRAYAARS